MIIEQSKRPIESIEPTECPFCDDAWAMPDGNHTTQGSNVVNLDEFRRHLGHHLQLVARYSLPRTVQNPNVSSHYAGDFQDRDVLLKGYWRVRDDCGRGWSIVLRKRAIFISLAYFLASWRKRKERSEREREKSTKGEEKEDQPTDYLECM